MTRDALARSQALDPERSFIVQAPAGSGKTELLTQRFLSLLSRVEFPEQILAITFTRKAAAEMRSRILRAIEGAAGPPPDSPHKRSTWELARAVREADARRGWSLTQHPARLRIQTIDALNALLARRLPILSSAGGVLEPTEDARPLYEAASRQLIERLGEGAHELHGLEALIAHLGNRVERLIELLSDLLARRDQWLHQVVHARSLDDLRGSLEATLRALVEHQLQRVHAAAGNELSQELALLARFAAANLLPVVADASRRQELEACLSFTGPIGGQVVCLPVWRSILGLLFTKDEDGDVRRSIDKRHGFPPTEKAMKMRMQRILAELADDAPLIEELRTLRILPDPAYSASQWRIVEALLEVLPLAVTELQFVFQREGKGDYVEAALRALEALGAVGEPTDLALAFDYRLQHILVDEFQDTSFTQLDLLERLTEGWAPGDGRTLFCVGDPMQSIYRFRQADVGLFLQLQSQGLRNVELTPLTLSSNFRSTPAIIEWVNRVFPSVFAADNDAELGAIRYSPSDAAVASDAGGVHVHPAIGEDEQAEARAAVAVVRESLERDADSTVAVLVTARTHVAVLARELTQAGIDYQAVEIELLRERPVVQDLMALTRALVHLADRTAWLAVLRAPWTGLSLADLHALVGEDRDRTARALLGAAIDPVRAPAPAPAPAHRRRARSDERQLTLAWFDAVVQSAELTPDGRRRAARAFEILSAALDERGRWSLRDWVERTWNALGGPAALEHAQDLADAESFFRRLEQIEVAGDLEDVALLEKRLDRLFAQPSGEGPARVEVMTIHKAKGLEFDTVILPALHRGVRGDDRDLLRWARIVGPAPGIVLAPVKADGAETDSIYGWIELLEKTRALHERSRLLYVAATRAKRDLHLFGAARLDSSADARLNSSADARPNSSADARTNSSADEATPTLRPPPSGTMLRMLWPAVKDAYEALASNQRRDARGIDAPTAQPIRRLPLDWVPPEPAPTIQGSQAVVAIDLQQPQFDWVSEVGRHVGTLVHRELDRATGTVARAKSSDDAHRWIVELLELGVPPDRCDDACARVRAAIDLTLSDPHGRWLLGLDGRVRDAESELAVSGVVDGQLINGVIDRTFIDEHGVRWVVDFKTSMHEGGGLDAFLEEEANRYRPQLTRYAKLMELLRPGERIRAALYFPLLQQWREVI